MEKVTAERIISAQAKAYKPSAFLFSIATQLRQGKTLSEKQVTAANKVIAAIEKRASERQAKIESENDSKGVWEEGRQTVSGKVVEIKQQERWEGGHYYGETVIVDKVKLELQDGRSIIVTGTNSFYENNDRDMRSQILVKVGDMVTVDTTVKVHAERTFWAYGSRTTLKEVG